VKNAKAEKYSVFVEVDEAMVALVPCEMSGVIGKKRNRRY